MASRNKKNKKFDRIKTLKKIKRENGEQYGKAGPHSDKREHRQHKKKTDDYMEEYLEEVQEEYELDYKDIGFSDIVTAFNEETIGSKVIESAEFFACLCKEIKKVNFSKCRQPGQAYIKMPKGCCYFVSAGVGKRTLNPEDYVVRLHREKVGLYLKRNYAAKVNNVAVVVYTKNAYMTDPDVTADEYARIRRSAYKYIIVAVLASAEVPSPLTPNCFVHNLAGGNKEALLWTVDEIREKAREIIDYSNEWCVVAD